MPLFNYKIKDESGKTLKGVIDAFDERQAALTLRERKFFIIEIIPQARQISFGNIFAKFKKVSFADITAFTRQLATMITSGLPIPEALSILTNQLENPAMRQIASDLSRDIQAGKSLASSLEKHKNHFSKIYISLIKAGESSGTLDEVLVRLADNLEKEKEFRGKIGGAMIYPAVIFVMMVTVVFIMMIFVVPKIGNIYKEMGGELPGPTRVLIQFSDVIANFWWLLIGIVIFGFVGFNAWRRTPLGRQITDRIILKLPIIGPLKKGVILTEFGRTLGNLIGTGIPILEALNILSDSLDNFIYQEAIDNASKLVEKGFPLATSLSQSAVFPPIVPQMIKVGEETGKLGDSLLKISHYYEMESETNIRGLTTALEPILLIFIGVGVGGVAIAVLMPLFNLVNVIK